MRKGIALILPISKLNYSFIKMNYYTYNNSKNILITGGTGFIGRNILESLSSRYKILAPSKEELDLKDEIAVFEYLKRNNVEVVIHAALMGEFGKDKVESMPNILADNLRFFFNLIRAKRFYKKMIFFSSGVEYDRRRGLKKVKETDFGQFIPEDEYSFYKYICSEYIEKSEDVISLILFGVYGKYEDYRSKFISNTIVKNLLKQDIVINQNVVFDYLFIDDLILVLDYFISKKAKFKRYNVTPNKSIDLITISNIINEISSYKSKIIILNDGLNNEYTADNSRLKSEISDLKFRDYRKGIKKLFNYYHRNIEKLDKDSIIKDKYLKFRQKLNNQIKRL